MAPRKSSSDLMKVGLEGFAMLDEYLGNKKRQQIQVVTQIPAAVDYCIDCYEAAKFYGGTVIADYPKKNRIKKPSMP